MAVTKKKPLGPLEASRAEQDAYARTSHGLQSVGTNMGAATRNRVTPPETVAPQPPIAPGPNTGGRNPQMATGTFPPPSGPVATASIIDVGACKVGDQITMTVTDIKNGMVSLGKPMVLPGNPQGAAQ
jgi:hypothetical protein